MAKVSIYEKDLTENIAQNVTENIIYVPGYSKYGPINKPTIVRTLSEFKKIFGNQPYSFVQDQNWPNQLSQEKYGKGSYALAGSYEKSFIYASRLLSTGLPIMFERLMKEEKIEDWTSSTTLTGFSNTFTEANPQPASEGDIESGVYYEKSGDEYIRATEFDNEKTYYLRDTDDSFILRSKYPGLEYNKLGYTLVRILESDDDIYTLTVYFDNEELETLNFSLKSGSAVNFALQRSDYIIFPTTTTSVELDEVEDIQTFNLDSDLNIDEFSTTDFYDLVCGYVKTIENEDINTPSIYEKIIDRNDYNLKVITSGSYPTYGLTKKVITSSDPQLYFDIPTTLSELLLATAGMRGDALALIDYNNDNNIISVSKDLNKDSSLNLLRIGTAAKNEYAVKYGAMFAPWGNYTLADSLGDQILPASFGYLYALGVSTISNPNWYAVAGVTRGYLNILNQVNESVSGSKAQYVQDKETCINPITNINPYGFCIWGNRTLNKNTDLKLSASSFLNVRMLVNDVKKLVYSIAKKLTFENNTNVLWLTFKSEIEPELDKMIAGNGLTQYRIMKKESTKKATLEAIISLAAVESVEDFEIDIELTDSYVTVQ